MACRPGGGSRKKAQVWDRRQKNRYKKQRGWIRFLIGRKANKIADWRTQKSPNRRAIGRKWFPRMMAPRAANRSAPRTEVQQVALRSLRLSPIKSSL